MDALVCQSYMSMDVCTTGRALDTFRPFLQRRLARELRRNLDGCQPRSSFLQSCGPVKCQSSTQTGFFGNRNIDEETLAVRRYVKLIPKSQECPGSPQYGRREERKGSTHL